MMEPKLSAMDFIKYYTISIERVGLPTKTGAILIDMFVNYGDFMACLKDTIPNALVDDKLSPEETSQALIDRQESIQEEVDSLLTELKNASTSLTVSTDIIHKWIIALSVFTSVSAYIVSLSGGAPENFYKERISDWEELPTTTKYALYDLYGILHRDELLETLVSKALNISIKEINSSLRCSIYKTVHEVKDFSKVLNNIQELSDITLDKGSILFLSMFLIWKETLLKEEGKAYFKKMKMMIESVFFNENTM